MNENGIAQAQTARTRLNAMGVQFDTVYASPLQRAVTTASIVSGRLPSQIISDERLIEIAFGEWEGREMAAVGVPLEPFFKMPHTYVPPQGGEDFASLLRRTEDFLRMVCSQHAGKHILAASHGAATAALLTQVRGLPLSELWKTPVHNCQIFKLTAVDGVWEKTAAIL